MENFTCSQFGDRSAKMEEEAKWSSGENVCSGTVDLGLSPSRVKPITLK